MPSRGGKLRSYSTVDGLFSLFKGLTVGFANAFKIEFEDRAAHARLLQCVLPASMYRISSAMKIKHKMCGGKAMERDSFLFSLASSRYAGQTDRPNVLFWGLVAHLKWDLLHSQEINEKLLF